MYKLITSISGIGDLLNDIGAGSRICLDVESTGLDPYTDTLLLLQLKTNDNTYLLDCRKIGIKGVTYVVSILRDSNKTIIGHNLAFDIKMLYHNTKELLENVFDTQVAEMIINAGLVRKFPSYKELVDKYCFVEISKETRDTFINYTGELTNDQLTYSALDVKWLDEIMDYQVKQLQNLGLTKISDLEMGLVPVFSMMEYRGIGFLPEEWIKIAEGEYERAQKAREQFMNDLINGLPLDKFENAYQAAQACKIPVGTKRLKAELENLRPEFIKSYLLENININSTYQLVACFNMSGIQVKDTNEKTLNKYKKHVLISSLLNYREAEKRVSTYGKNFFDHINPVTGRIHSQFNQLVSTGRISSDSPNMQNIPRDELFRKCFVARKGYKLITADYSQAELRLMAVVSGEPELIKAYMDGIDLHVKSATIIYNKPMEDITKEERYWGKTLNFSLNYGISEWGLFNKFGLPMEKGREYIASYFSGYSTLKAFVELAGDAVWKAKRSSTPYGRKRFFEDRKIFNDVYESEKYKAGVKREGVNHIIQGGIADVVKLSMLDIFRNNPFGDKMYMLLQVHDEIVVEVHESVVDDAAKFINDCMVRNFQPFLKEVPAIADVHISDCWSKT
jgi:DNA polymerase I